MVIWRAGKFPKKKQMPLGQVAPANRPPPVGIVNLEFIDARKTSLKAPTRCSSVTRILPLDTFCPGAVAFGDYEEETAQADANPNLG